MDDSSCPTRARLRLLAAGHLSDELLDEIEPHIQSCRRCQCRLAKFEAQSDALIDVLRAAAQSPIHGLDDALQRRLILAEAVGPRIWRELDETTQLEASVRAQ